MANAGGPRSGSRAVFLDRDGTLVDDPPPGYLHDPGQVRLLPGAGEAVARLNRAGFLVIVVSNQSGIARGLYSAEAFHAVQRRLAELLALHHGAIDGSFFCPHHPDFPAHTPCDCRKPGTKLFRQAAEAFAIDFRSSWFVGDRLDDLTPARTLGGRGVLVETGHGREEQAVARAAGFPSAPDVLAATDLVLRSSPPYF